MDQVLPKNTNFGSARLEGKLYRMKNLRFVIDSLFYFSFRNDDSLLQATSSVTEALQRTSTLMQQELEKSSYSASALGKRQFTFSMHPSF